MTEQQFGPYRLLSLLGRGGMGEVWRARDTRKNRTVALKVLGSWLGGDPQFAARFRRESDLAAQLSAPNIVSIHDYGEIGGRLFIEMPLIVGTDLGALLENGPLPPARAVGIVAQVARALAVAHDAGLVHRDVKPSNVLVTTTADGDDHAYLIDFGIAKALDGTRLSMSGAVVGTAAYMAPESFTGHGDARSDVYSLGCVLYEALTGEPPFSAPHFVAYAVVHQNEPVPRPSERRPEVPVVLDAVVTRALAKAPEERYPTATDLATAARDALQIARPYRESSAPKARPTPPATPQPRLAAWPADRPGPGITPETPAPSGLPETHRVAASFLQPAGVPTAQAPRRRRTRWWVPALVAVLVLAAGIGFAVRLSGSTMPGAPSAAATPLSNAPGRSSSAPLPNLTLAGHTDVVDAVATTQLDGRPVAVTGSADKAIRIWDLTTGRQRGQPLTGHTSNVWAVTTTELDGKAVAVTGSWDDSVRIWDLDTGQQRGQPLTGHTGDVETVAITELDGKPVAISGSDDQTLRIWDLNTGQQRGQPLTGHTDWVRTVATTELDGQPVAVSGSDDKTLRIWDLTTGQQRGQPLTGHTGEVRSVAITQLDGRSVAVTGSTDKTVRIWNLDTGQQIGQPLTGHTSGVYSVATLQLDGRPVAVTGSEDRTVRIWDLTTGRQIGQPLTGHTDTVLSVGVIQVDGRPVAVTGGLDHSVRTWDLLAAIGK